jgi:hypothetical protein
VIERLTPGIKVVACEKHWKKEEDGRVRYDSNPEVVEFRFPGRRPRRDNLCSITADHLLWVNHEEWDGNPNECKYQYTDLDKTCIRPDTVVDRKQTYVPFPTMWEMHGIISL